MSFAIWGEKPKFGEAEYDADGKWTGAGLNPGELIYYQMLDGTWAHFVPGISQVPKDAKFCVTSEPAEEIAPRHAAMMAPVVAKPSLQEQIDALTAALAKAQKA